MPYLGAEPAPSALTVTTSDIADDAVTTAKIADNALTLAKMVGGTDGNIISYDASGNPVAIATGNDGQVLHSAGAGAPPAFETLTAGFTQGTLQTTTSGSGHKTFTGIPAGISMLIFNIYELSLDGTDNMEIRLGDSGGIETTGYEGTYGGIANTTISHNNADTGFPIALASAGKVLSGHYILTKQSADNNTWVGSHAFRRADYDYAFGAGFKQLSAELTQCSIGPFAANSYDAGSVNIMYL